MPTATAHLNKTLLASTTTPQLVEGNLYFPPDALVDKSLFRPSAAPKTVCPWKGTASYYDIEVDGETVKGAAWYYPEPKTERAMGLKGWVAFYKSKIDVKSE